MYLYIMNLMKIISLMYKKSSLFIVYCVNIVHLMESIFESNCFRIVCPLVLYGIISILLLNELVLVHMTIPQEHRHTNSSFSVLECLLSINVDLYLVCLVSDLIILCIIHVHYFSIINPRHPIHVPPHLYLHDIQLVCSIIDKCIIIYKINNFLWLIFTHSDHVPTYKCIIVLLYSLLYFKIIAKNCMLSYFIISQNYLVSCPSCICTYLLCVSPFVYRLSV